MTYAKRDSCDLDTESDLRVRAAFKRLFKLTYYRMFRLQVRLMCWYTDLFRDPDPGVPLPPAMLRFRVSESLLEERFLQIGTGCANLIQQHLFEMGLDLSNPLRILDFGCGCGRTIRWLIGCAPNVEFHGVDIDSQAVSWCQKHLHGGRFLTTAFTPPLPFPAEHFEAVYCLSVFTHLDESMQDLWLPELMRVLKPGGVLLLSVHGQGATQALDAKGRQLLEAAGFVHRRSEKLKGIVPVDYHTTWHAKEYVIRRVSQWFSDVRYSVIAGGLQDFVLARKSAGPEKGLLT